MVSTSPNTANQRTVSLHLPFELVRKVIHVTCHMSHDESHDDTKTCDDDMVKAGADVGSKKEKLCGIVLSPFLKWGSSLSSSFSSSFSFSCVLPGLLACVYILDN